jgi:PAS domain S-box-containing protein
VTNEEDAPQMDANRRLADAILATAVDPIIVIDRDGLIQEANTATTTLFGHERSAMVGRNVSMLMPEPYRSEHDGYIRRYLTTGEKRIIGVGREVQAERADGSTFPMALAVTEVTVDESNDDRRFTGIIHDLTDRVATQHALEEANRNLEAQVADRTAELRSLLVDVERSNRDLEQFAYIASHDLQAPLRNVRQGLELLDEHLETATGAGFDDEAQELQRLITAAVLRMEDLIRGLLDFSRVDRRSGHPDENIDLNELIDELVELLHVDLEAADATLEIGELPIVVGDRVQLRQLLQNLLQNALTYRQPEQPPQITVGATATEEDWIVSVGDDGIGIDEEQHERIFELFRRGHAGFSGVGLGLALAQRIVERHGGRIWVDSAPNQGATFHVALPKSEQPD